ncbi:uncharacterized protein LOC124289613 isoform X2 [Haliotis rubra]|uniref:uncharacterized protein LOC124289613 isoform X2 n=1 Tax=Haliotis rubra TaxID=36100 RepID=UPI001EE5D082|nr:uncharacterized protein LOC124289613 isoform X2 [Haliotis rubra]
MKRKQPDDDNSSATSEEWLSTRNKQKIKPASPKHKRRRSSVVRGFPRQSKSSLWELTQTTAPHPLLFTATKQTTIQGFFHTNSAKQPTKESSNEPQAGEHSSCDSEHSSYDSEHFLDSHIEFDPLFSSTNVCSTSGDKSSSNQDLSSPNSNQHSREATLQRMCDSHEDVPVRVEEHLSHIDFSKPKLEEPVIKRSDSSCPDMVGNQSLDKSILPSCEPEASQDEGTRWRQQHELEDDHKTDKTGFRDALFTVNLSDSLPLRMRKGSRGFKLRESEKQGEENVCEDTVRFVDSSLTFTQTFHDDSCKSGPRLCFSDSLDIDCDRHCVSGNVLTKHDMDPSDEILVRRLRRGCQVRSVARGIDVNVTNCCLELEEEECKTSPSASISWRDDRGTPDLLCLLEHGGNGLEPTSLLGRSRGSLNDHNLDPKLALKPNLSDSVNSLDLSPPATSDGGGATGPVRPLQQICIWKSGQDDSDTDRMAQGSDLSWATRAGCDGSLTNVPHHALGGLCKTSRSLRHQHRVSGTDTEGKCHLWSEGSLMSSLSKHRNGSAEHINVVPSEGGVSGGSDSLVFTPSQGPNAGPDEVEGDVDADFLLDSQLI